MHRIAVAFRAFFRVLASARAAAQVEWALGGQAAPTSELLSSELPTIEMPALKSAPAPRPTRSDALNLLATLQREARLVDFLMEPIAGYADAQIGAAVRDIHRDCAAAIERVFAPKQIESAEEGATIELPDGFDPARMRLSGDVRQPPFRGRLCHHGWQATRCDLPEWSCDERSRLVIAPAEIEIK
jgi:Domain of unknown function (DUF2760)